MKLSKRSDSQIQTKIRTDDGLSQSAIADKLIESPAQVASLQVFYQRCILSAGSFCPPEIECVQK